MEMKDQISAALAESKPTLIEFFAAWCSHCQNEEPVIEELRGKLGDKANIIQVDVDKYPALAREYRVRAYPSFFLFKDGQMFWHDGGEKPLSELEDMIKRVI